MRKSKKKPLTERACNLIAKALENHPTPDAVIDKSTTNSWTDIYPNSLLPGAKSGRAPSTPLDQIDYEEGLDLDADGHYRIAGNAK